MALRVAIVDDDASVGETIRLILNRSKKVECVASYQSGIEALQGIPTVKPDIALMDIRMPKMSGIECARRLKLFQPKIRIVMHTGYSDVRTILCSLMAGCDGFLVKAEGLANLSETLESALDGEMPFSPQALRSFLSSFQTVHSSGNPILSLREEEVLTLMLQHFRHKEIATELGVSLKTVRTHVYHIQKKLNASGYGGAIKKFISMLCLQFGIDAQETILTFISSLQV